MENKKMWVGLVKQMIYEIVILFLLYLFIGNNFGNNIFSDVRTKIFYNSSFWDTMDGCMSGLISLILSNILFLLEPVVLILNIVFAFAPFWMPILLFYLLSHNCVIKFCAKAFGGQYLDTASPKIQDWYDKSRKAYVIFVIISRVVFLLLLLFKAINAPTNYIAKYYTAEWELEGNLMGVLIFIAGLIIALISALTAIRSHRFNAEKLKKYICPNCGKIAWIKKKYKTQVGYGTYDDGHEGCSGYYRRETIGEVVDSAGNHVGDVEGDVWVDTSTTHYKKLTPDVFEKREVYAPCGCEIKIETIEK